MRHRIALRIPRYREALAPPRLVVVGCHRSQAVGTGWIIPHVRTTHGIVELYPVAVGSPAVSGRPDIREMLVSEDLTRLDDHALAVLHREGHPGAFGELYARHQRHAYGFVLRRLRLDPQDAWDIVQNAFLKALRGLDTYQHGSKFQTWLLTIVFREGLDHLHRRRRDGPGPLPVDTDTGTPVGSGSPLPRPEDVDDRLWYQAVGRHLPGCLEKLERSNPDHALYFREHILIGTSQIDLARRLGITLENGHQRLRRARKALRECIEKVLKGER